MVRSLLFLLIITFSLAGCGLLGGDDDPFKISGKLVFTVVDDSNNRQLFSMNANGTILQQLTQITDNEAFHPSWSPDGEQIVFSTTLQSSVNGPSIYVMDADGDNLQPMDERDGLAGPTSGYNPSWSPDGTKIAFNFCVDCQQSSNQEIFVYDIEADTVIQLTQNQSEDIQPVWSPDGNRVAFVSDRDYVGGLPVQKDLYVMNSDGSNVERFTQAGYVNNPIWSPAGTSIAYEAGMQLNEVHILDISTKQATTFESGFDFTVNPQWDSLGTQLMVLGGDDEQSLRTLQLFELESKKMKVLNTVSLRGFAIGRDYNWVMLPRE